MAWIARDIDGELWMYTDKPFKDSNDAHSWSVHGECGWVELSEDMIDFPVSWEDDEPIEVQIIKV